MATEDWMPIDWDWEDEYPTPTSDWLWTKRGWAKKPASIDEFEVEA